MGALVLAWCAAAGAGAEPPVRFAPERDYGPFVYQTESGELRGLSVDLLRLVARQAGLSLVDLPAAPLAEQLDALRTGRADLISSLRPTPERAEYLAFSLPYVSVPAVLIRRADAPPQDLEGLAGKAVAVGQSYAVEGFVRTQYPQVRWVAVPDDGVALRGVADGRFAGAVVDVASAAFIQRQAGLAGLQPVGAVGFEYRLSFAVPRQRTDLLARLDAGIRALPPDERQAVLDRWLEPLGPISPPPTPGQSRAIRWGLTLVLVAAAGALALSLRRGRRARSGDAADAGPESRP
jgi:ABC-type amino acid transport substrate-binding protein